MSVAIFHWKEGVSLSLLHSLTKQVGLERGYRVDEWTQSFKREPIGDSLMAMEIPHYISVMWRLVREDHEAIEFRWDPSWRKDGLISRIVVSSDTDIVSCWEGDYGDCPKDVVQRLRATKLRDQLDFYDYFKALFQTTNAQLCCAFDSNGWDMKEFDPEASRLQLLKDWHCVLAPTGWQKLLTHLERQQLVPSEEARHYDRFLFLNKETGQTCDTLEEVDN